MRRFEPRSKHAPMDFSYESDQKNRGGSPFRMESTRPGEPPVAQRSGDSND